MRILLIGKNGQVGWELQRTLAPLGKLSCVDFPEIDLTDEGNIQRWVRETRPRVIVNAAAYTAVDRAETEPDTALAVNAEAPRILAEEALNLGSALIHYSTEYVFDGTKGETYLESDSPNPLNVYGRSKLAGEGAIQEVGGAYLILRTSWVYSLRRESFLGKVLGWARKQPTLRLVTDQVGNPTWARMLSEVTAQVLAMGGRDPAGWLGERGGLYHLAGDGAASRLEWAQAILKNDPRRKEQVAREILPALTADFPTPAQRPLFAALNCDHFTEIFGLRLPPWDVSLKMAMEAGA